MGVLKAIGTLYLKVAGWEAVGEVPHGKYIVVAAPHTSNWDLPFTLSVAWVLGVKIHWLGKHTLFEGPFGGFFKALRGVPIDRRSSTNATKSVAEWVSNYPGDMMLAVAVEGTRSRKDYWKSGFFYIAKEAQIPLILGFLDYKNKRGGFGPVLQPTDHPRELMDQMREFYNGIEGKIHDNTTPVRLREEHTDV